MFLTSGWWISLLKEGSGSPDFSLGFSCLFSVNNSSCGVRVLLSWFLTTPPASHPMARQQCFDLMLAAPPSPGSGQYLEGYKDMELDVMILMGPFQLDTFCESKILIISASISTLLQHGHKQSLAAAASPGRCFPPDSGTSCFVGSHGSHQLSLMHGLCLLCFPGARAGTK